MAVTQCIDCGGNVSTRAATCPHCGAPTLDGNAAPAKQRDQTKPNDNQQLPGLQQSKIVSTCPNYGREGAEPKICLGRWVKTFGRV